MKVKVASSSSSGARECIFDKLLVDLPEDTLLIGFLLFTLGATGFFFLKNNDQITNSAKINIQKLIFNILS